MEFQDRRDGPSMSSGPGVLNGGEFPLGDVWQWLEAFLVALLVRWEVLLACSGQRPGRLHNIQQRTGRPTAGIQPGTSTVPRLRNPDVVQPLLWL